MRKKMKSKGPNGIASKGFLTWNSAMKEFLIDSLLHEESIGNRHDLCFTAKAYENILKGFQCKFGLRIDRKHLKNHLKHVKETFYEAYDMFENRSGFSWAADTKTFTAAPADWKALIKAKSAAKKWKTKTINDYDKLLELFGRNRANRTGIETLKKEHTLSSRRHISHDLAGKDVDSQMGVDAEDHELELVETPEAAEVDNAVENVASSTLQGDSTVAQPVPLCSSTFASSTLHGDSPAVQPVPCGSSGRGLPYAPVDWPCPGDVWSWKVGNRKSVAGYWKDRYISAPPHLCGGQGKKLKFSSRLQLEEFMKKEYPDSDLDAFFSSFAWKIPAVGPAIIKGKEHYLSSPSDDDQDEPELYDEPTEVTGNCKARNKLCRTNDKFSGLSTPTKSCNVCCTSDGFCCECCCILCNRTVDFQHKDYTFIRCQAMLEENRICGHIGHLECALRCYMAGTVGGQIGLDVEYYCRQCDQKTDLMPHVTELVRICVPLKSRDEIELILNLGLCVLRGSQQIRANNLEDFMASALAKLKCGDPLEELWKLDGTFKLTSCAGGNSSSESGTTLLGTNTTNQMKETMVLCDPNCHGNSDDGNPAFKIDIDVTNALQELRRSQESEYRQAEETLFAQRDLIVTLYQLLEKEKSLVADPSSLSNSGPSHSLLARVRNREDQIRTEEDVLQRMMRISGGFGRTSKRILREDFGLDYDE